MADDYFMLIEPLPGYTPTIGRLVSMLTYVRQGLVKNVSGLSGADLDHLHDARANSIGALLAHAAAVERWYQILTFEDRRPSAGEEAAWAAALNLGQQARMAIRGRDLQVYLDDLAKARDSTLSAFARRDDVWLEQPLRALPEMNAHWAWFHVGEDEISHRGQIRWLRARLHPDESGAAGVP